jgi:hypothetical protein
LWHGVAAIVDGFVQSLGQAKANGALAFVVAFCNMLGSVFDQVVKHTCEQVAIAIQAELFAFDINFDTVFEYGCQIVGDSHEK